MSVKFITSIEVHDEEGRKARFHFATRNRQETIEFARKLNINLHPTTIYNYREEKQFKAEVHMASFPPGYYEPLFCIKRMS